MNASPKPPPVMACEDFWADKAGGAYQWTRAVQGYTPGEWHHCCPGGCGGGVTFAERDDGSIEIRCHERRCAEDDVVRALVAEVAACR